MWAVHVLSLEGRPQGPVEWETDRARFLGRGRDTDRPAALDGRALSGTTGIVLDPDLQPAPADPAGPGRVGAPLVRHRHRLGSRDRRSARPEVPRPERGLPHVRARLHARAERSASSGHLERRGAAVRASGVESALRRRLAAGGPGHDCRRTSSARRVCGRTAFPAICRSCSCACVGDDDVALVRQVLQAQEYWRLKGLSADVVILNEDPSSYLDEMHAQLTALLDNGPWRTWKHRSGGAYLLRGDRIGKAERTLIEAVARAVLGGDRGDLRAQLDKPHPVQSHRRPAFAAAVSARADRVAGHRPADRAAVDDADQRPRRVHRRGPGLRDRARGRPGNAAALGRTSSPTPISAPSSPRRARRTPGRRTAAKTGLTSFANDPVVDPTAEALFIRDDDSGDAWSPTPGPMARHADERAVRRPSFRRRHAFLARRREASATSSTCSSTSTIR